MHDHNHHGSGHDGHPHGVSADADRGKLLVALARILGFMAFEASIGILAHSLALLFDAGTCSRTPAPSACSCAKRRSDGRSVVGESSCTAFSTTQF